MSSLIIYSVSPSGFNRCLVIAPHIIYAAISPNNNPENIKIQHLKNENSIFQKNNTKLNTKRIEGKIIHFVNILMLLKTSYFPRKNISQKTIIKISINTGITKLR
jgi:hypothetical protein